MFCKNNKKKCLSQSYMTDKFALNQQQAVIQKNIPIGQKKTPSRFATRWSLSINIKKSDYFTSTFLPSDVT